MFGLHHPPCPLDDLERQAISLGELGLGPRGAELPEALHSRLLESQRQAREEAATWRESEARYARQLRAVQQRRAQAARRPAPPPAPVPTGGLRCTVCGRALAPELAKVGRHILC